MASYQESTVDLVFHKGIEGSYVQTILLSIHLYTLNSVSSICMTIPIVDDVFPESVRHDSGVV